MVPAHKLEIWPGFVTAVQEMEGGLMLTCHVSFKVLRYVQVFVQLLLPHSSYRRYEADLWTKRQCGGSVSFWSVMRIRMNYFKDPDPGYGNSRYVFKWKSRIWPIKKLLISIFYYKIQVFKILWKKWNLFTSMLLYMRLAKVTVRPLRSQKSC